MSLEAWGDEGDCGIDGYVTEGRAEELFVAGARAMREMLARFVEQGGDNTTAMSIRANWNPKWGKDPGRPDRIASEGFDDVGDYKPTVEVKEAEGYESEDEYGDRMNRTEEAGSK